MAKREKLWNYRNTRRQPTRQLASIVAPFQYPRLEYNSLGVQQIPVHTYPRHESRGLEYFICFLLDTTSFLEDCYPARGTLLSISCLVVGGGGITPPLDPFRSRRWRIWAAGSSMVWQDETGQRFHKQSNSLI